MVIYGKLPVNM